MIFTISDREYNGNFVYILKQFCWYQSSASRIQSHLIRDANDANDPLTSDEVLDFIKEQITLPANTELIKAFLALKFIPIADREVVELVIQGLIHWLKHSQNQKQSNIAEIKALAFSWLEMAEEQGSSPTLIASIQSQLEQW